MPGRKIPLITDQIYHVLNRGVASQPISFSRKDYQRILETIIFYQNRSIPLRYSFFLRLPQKQKVELTDKLRTQKKFLVDIIAYCLMPNHIHLLLKQNEENGISIFMSNFTNSYTRYFNAKRRRVGPLFQGKFKAVRIETDEQFMHVSRYIHLNPYSNYLVKRIDDLNNYQYSSLPEYLGYSISNICQKETVLQNFRDQASYKKFIFNQADYQRRLQDIKHLLLER